MRVVPKLNVPAIGYFEAHVPVWELDPAPIGLTPQRVAALAALTAGARAAYLAQQVARNHARSATVAFNEAMENLRAAGSACVASIRAAAAAAPEPMAVYDRAVVPPPADPGPIAAPGTPDSFAAELAGNTGLLRLGWRCKNPAGSVGTVYEIRRQLEGVAGGGGPIIAVVGDKHFLDDTIPAGTACVLYTVTAVRSTRRGRPGTHVVNFGSDVPAARPFQSRNAA